jgi:hypothetical protein
LAQFWGNLARWWNWVLSPAEAGWDLLFCRQPQPCGWGYPMPPALRAEDEPKRKLACVV